MAHYHCAKIHQLSSRNKLSVEIPIFGLSRFSAQNPTLSAGSLLRHLYLDKLKGYNGDSFRLVSRSVVLANAVKRFPPSPKVGLQGPQKLVSRAIFSKISLLAAATVRQCFASAIQK